MAWKLTIDGVDRTSQIHHESGVSITLPYNERSTARFTCKPGYVPPLRKPVIIYDQDGTTPIFGGVIYQRASRGASRYMFTEVECVDWTLYTDWRSVNAGYQPNTVVSLKQVLQDLITYFLGDYGITLAPGQVTGPAGSHPDLRWEHKPVSQVLRDLTTFSGGYLWSISPAKVLEMKLPGSAPAPFSLTDDSDELLELTWSESSDKYATRVTLVCGGTDTASIVQTWTVASGDVTNGYLEADVPSTPTGGVSVTVNGVPRTIGGVGSELRWDWATHRITVGTFAPSVGNVVALTYTAQYPFTLTVDSGVTPVAEVVTEAPEIKAKPPALTMANQMLAQANQAARELNFKVKTPGLAVGQTIAINLLKRDTTVSALITSITIDLVTNTHWEYSVKAVGGTYQGSALDFFRTLATGRVATATGAAPSYSPGTNPVIVAGVHVYLGGSRNTGILRASPAYTPVVGYVPFVASTTFLGRVRVDLWARNAAIGCTARLYDVTVSSAAGTSSTVTSQTATPVDFTVAITAGHSYRLEVLPGAANQDVYCVGTLESL